MTSNNNINQNNAVGSGKKNTATDKRETNPRYQQDFLNDSGWDDDPLDQNQLPYQPGEKIDDRVVIKELGRGGMGIVYLTERRKHNFTSQEALKISLNLSEPLRFQREVKLLSKLNHPSICKIIDVGVTRSNDPYFVMEHIDGMPVTGFCQKEVTSIAKVLVLFVDICEAIAYIHNEGVIHRDIKPSNILALKLGGIRVLDFGIAKFLNKRGDTFNTDMQRPFTPAYASPEQKDPNSDLNEMSDIYSLGVLFVEILNGGLNEQQRNDLSQVIHKLERYAWETEGIKVSDNLKRILAKMVVSNRERRYQTVKDVLVELNEELRVVRSQEVLSNVRVLEKENELAMLNRMDADTELVQLKKEIKISKLLKKQMIVEGQSTERLSDQITNLSNKVKRRLRSGKAFQKGDIFDGRFELVSFIKSGGFGSVWKGIDLHREELVAIKILHHQFSADLTRRERFFRGARKMMQLKHSHIVKVVLKEGFHDGVFYFVMEYCSGGDLQEAVQENRLSRHERLTILSQITEALIYAHSEGVIHRDVKPGNILLDANNHAKLTDFDLVHVHDETGGTRTGALGSFIFSAPETMENAKNATPSSDLYSLGMSAVFCLSNKNLSLDVLRDPTKYTQTMKEPANLQKAILAAISFNKEERKIDLPKLKFELDKTLRLVNLLPSKKEKSKTGIYLFAAALILVAIISLFFIKNRSPQQIDTDYARKEESLENLFADISFEQEIPKSNILAFSSDASRIIKLIDSRKLGLWKVSDGSLDYTLELPTPPRSIHFSKESDKFTYTDNHGIIYFGSLKENAKLRNISKELNGLQVSGAKRTAFIDNKRQLLIIPDSNTLIVYHLSRRKIKTIKQIPIMPYAIAFNQERGIIAFSSHRRTKSGLPVRALTTFNYIKEKKLASFDINDKRPLHKLFFSQDGNYISRITLKNIVYTYDLKKRKPLATITLPRGNPRLIHFNPNSNEFFILSNQQSITKWNFITGENLGSISTIKFTGRPHTSASGCGTEIAWSDYHGNSVIFDCDPGNVIQIINRYTHRVQLIERSSQGQEFVVWRNGGRLIQNFNLTSDHGINQYDSMDFLGYTDTQQKNFLEAKGTDILLRDTYTKAIKIVIKPKPGHQFDLSTIQLSASLFASEQRTNEFKSIICVYDINSRSYLFETPTSAFSPYRILNLPNQRLLLTEKDQSIQFFNLDSGKLEHLLPTKGIVSTFTSAENHPLLAIVTYDGQLSVYRMDNFQQEVLFEHNGFNHPLTKANFSKDGNFLFVTSTVACDMYHVDSQTKIFSKEGSFSTGIFTNNRYVTVTKNNKEIIFFDIRTGQKSLTFRPMFIRDWLAFTEDGQFAGSDAVIANLFDRTHGFTKDEKDFIRLKYDPHLTAKALDLN